MNGEVRQQEASGEEEGESWGVTEVEKRRRDKKMRRGKEGSKPPPLSVCTVCVLYTRLTAGEMER